MACSNTIEIIATEIISDLYNDSSLSNVYVETWLLDNIGKLNNAIGSNFIIDDTNEISPCIDDAQKDIFKWLFICRYYANLAKNNLGAGAYDWSEVREGDSVIRRVSKNEIAKTYLSLAKNCEESLKEVIKFYRMNKALPKSISSWTTPYITYTRVDDN